MKFLADMGISDTTVNALKSHGHDAVHLSDQGLIRLPDDQILEKAKREDRVVLTVDLDFGDLLAITRAHLPSVIIFRLQNQTPASLTPRLFQTLAQCQEELENGAIITVDETRWRIRKLPVA